jgi:hypothetical protein
MEEKTMNDDTVEIGEYDAYLQKHIQGMFSTKDMEIMKEEIEKLKPGDIYLEIGVDEGKSMAVAHHYAKPGVFIIGIDFHDVYIHSVSIGRGAFAEKEGMIGFQKHGFFIHGDADVFAELWTKPISLMFIDGGHDYFEVKKNSDLWAPKMKKGGTILYHDIDYGPPGVKGFLDDHYGKDKWEALHGKIGRVRT